MDKKEKTCGIKQQEYNLSDKENISDNEKINTSEHILHQKKETENTEVTEISRLKNILHEELEKEKDRFIRLFAEFENYKKRVRKEKIEFFTTANEELIIKLLPVLDDFDRGIKEISQSKGMMLIREKFISILKEIGLKKYNVEKGDDFNTDFHEAISQLSNVDKKLVGKIVDIIEAGYLLGNKLIRHAKVIIGKK